MTMPLPVCLSRWKALALSALLSLGLTGSAKADSITFTGSSGSLAAAATFSITGNTLTLSLTNTSTSGVSNPAQVLTAVFFSNNSVALTPVSASVAAGSLQLVSGSSLYTNNTTNVGAEWAASGGLNTGFNPAGSGSYQGVSAVGFSLFGPPDIIDEDGPLFSSFNPAGISGNPPDGLAGGLISDVGLMNPNGGVQNRWLINDTATFQFTFEGSLSTSDIGNVLFQYGTSLSEPRFGGTPNTPPPPAVPAPPALVLAAIGIGCGALGSLRRRLSRK